MRRWRRVVAFLAVDAVLMAGWYWLTMAHLRSLPSVFRWDGGTVFELLVPFGASLILANVAVLILFAGFRREQDSRASTAVTIILAIAAFAAALFFLGMAVFMLAPQY